MKKLNIFEQIKDFGWLTNKVFNSSTDHSVFEVHKNISMIIMSIVKIILLVWLKTLTYFRKLKKILNLLKNNNLENGGQQCMMNINS